MEEEKNEQPVMEFENEPTSAEDKKIKKLQKKVEEQKQELEECDDRIKRLMAEFENFKKRSNKERSGMYNSVMGDVVTALLPAIDNLEKAVEAETSDEQYKSGVEMVLNQIKDVLKSNGVEEIKAVGEPFDPSLHEAVSSVVDESLGSKIIKEEFRKGYMIGDRVLRHSLVVVAN
ncbi:MAG: nucleotide exchange factor GrpE [Clostridia bacterium]|nr:nucleotide exchange factor GrpE [Clostridia bacterium]